MHVALVVRAFDRLAGGREAWVEGFARFLLERGDAVTVVCEAASSALPVAFSMYTPKRLPFARARAAAAALATVGADAVYDVGVGLAADVLHLHTGSDVASERRFVAAGPLLLRARVALVPLTRWRWARSRALEARQIAHSRRVVAVSRLAERELRGLYRFSAGRLLVVTNGTDARALDPGQRAQAGELRRRLSPAGETVFLAVGHNHLLKGFDRALHALLLLRGRGLHARLVVAGGPTDGMVATRAAALGVSAHVTLLGTVSDMAPLYSAADALIHPTRWDACSLATLEALAAGRPVVTTALNGAAERIIEGETGFVLAEGESDEALAAHMATLCDPAIRERMGRAAALSAPAFSLGRNHAAIAALLDEAASARRGGA